ncbi:MAG: radical SAM protein, partial [Candidatus Omnitrophota bacterium]
MDKSERGEKSFLAFLKYRLAKIYSIERKRDIDYRMLKKDVPLPIPNFIQLEPTTKCNCKCKTCTRRTINPRRLNKDLSLEDFKKIVAQIRPLKEIKLQGMGEPLLCQNLMNILAYGTSKGIEFTVITNGTVVSNENIEPILKYFKNIVISVDSPCKENFEKIREGASYDQVLENVKKLIECKKRIGLETIIGVNFVATHFNFGEIPLLFELCERIGIDEISIVEVENWMIPTQKGYSEEREFI